MKIGTGVRQGWTLSPILFNLYREYLTKKAPERYGFFRIRTVKCEDDLVLMAMDETVLRGMTDRLVEIGRWYGKGMHVTTLK
jgi:hypothetical protein